MCVCGYACVLVSYVLRAIMCNFAVLHSVLFFCVWFSACSVDADIKDQKARIPLTRYIQVDSGVFLLVVEAAMDTIREQIRRRDAKQNTHDQIEDGRRTEQRCCFS